MAEILETLIGIQDQVIKCRRLAAEIGDSETSRRLHELADDIEQRAREVDREACSPELLPVSERSVRRPPKYWSYEISESAQWR